jgi:hypothetical protein
MVNPILPRLLGVSDEPASLKIPGHTTHLTMIMESQLTDDHGCEYSARVRSRNQYLSSLSTFLDATLVMAKISSREIALSTYSRCSKLKVPFSPSNRQPSSKLFRYRVVGFDARVQRVWLFPPFPGATAVICVFASEYATD